MLNNSDENQKNKLRVAIGIIWNQERSEILISLRPLDKELGGLWEFPGGKVELIGDCLEGDVNALIRELAEELGIYVINCEHWLDLSYQYKNKQGTNKHVDLVVYDVWDFEGIPEGLEGQEIKWIKLEDFKPDQFPAANIILIDKLKQRLG